MRVHGFSSLTDWVIGGAGGGGGGKGTRNDSTKNQGLLFIKKGAAFFTAGNRYFLEGPVLFWGVISCADSGTTAGTFFYNDGSHVLPVCSCVIKCVGEPPHSSLNANFERSVLR